MAGPRVCKECGIPLMVSKSHKWDNNGAIIQTGKLPIRMTFFDFDRIDSIFHGLEEMVGVPLEHIIVECARRGARQYVDSMIPSPVRKILKHVGFKLVVGNLSTLGKVLGYGDIHLVESRRRNKQDYRLTFQVTNPHSLTIIRANILGAVESIEDCDAYSELRQLGENQYEVVVRLGSHPVEMQGRLEERLYVYRPGRIEYERCPVCHIPLEVSAYRWDLERGTITQPQSGERMAFFTPWGLEAMLNELEQELQETIPDMVIETQRLYARERLQHITGWMEIEDLFRGLAVKGLGYVVSFLLDEDHLELKVENSCLETMLVGTAQGLFELSTGRESSVCEWDVTHEDILTVKVSGR
jgi:hypothetical protein